MNITARSGNAVTKRGHAGAVLLEVIAAMTLFAIAGVALLELALQSDHAVSYVVMNRAELAKANAFLESVALWTRDDLDRHLGRHSEGQFALLVDRIAPTLYHVVLTTSHRGNEAPLLETTLYREQP